MARSQTYYRRIPAATLGLDVMTQAVRLSGFGFLGGVLIWLPLNSVIASEIYGISASDPMTIVVVGATLMALTLVAAYVPAQRATKIDPMVALRAE